MKRNENLLRKAAKEMKCTLHPKVQDEKCKSCPYNEDCFALPEVRKRIQKGWDKNKKRYKKQERDSKKAHLEEWTEEVAETQPPCEDWESCPLAEECVGEDCECYTGKAD